MRAFFLFLLLLLSALIYAQRGEDRVTDVVYIRGEKPVEGTVLEYDYGEKVVLVTGAGDTRTVEWDDLIRVNFRLERAPRKAQKKKPVTETELPNRTFPSRKVRHQVSGHLGVGGGGQSQFGGTITNFGGGVAYHLVRPLGRLQVGLGLDLALMSHSRQENVLAATALAEYALNTSERKASPFLRLEAGPSLPVGSLDDDFDITERNLSPLIHPSVGVVFNAGKKQWTSLVLDLGYRFLNSSFIITTETLDVIERNVEYRRLVLRGALRF
ncbi:MAG: hypothetical protein AAFZ52_00435 [Bacteroidota bacterium]